MARRNIIHYFTLRRVVNLKLELTVEDEIL